MSVSGFDNWRYNRLDDNYDPDKIDFSGRDMSDAYQSGSNYLDTFENLERENEALRGLLGARIRVEEGFKEQLSTTEVRDNGGTI